MPITTKMLGGRVKPVRTLQSQKKTKSWVDPIVEEGRKAFRSGTPPIGSKYNLLQADKDKFDRWLTGYHAEEALRENACS